MKSMEASKHKMKKEGQVLHHLKRSIRTAKGGKGKEKISPDDVQENDKIYNCKDHCGENGRVIECPVCGSTLLKHHGEGNSSYFMIILLLISKS